MYLTVYFDGQFWVGVLQQPHATGLRVARHIFGAEPSDIEVLHFIQHDSLDVLACATVAVSPDHDLQPMINPKRAAREAAKIMRQPSLSTKAQLALQLQHEQDRQVRQHRGRAEREIEAERKREIARQKAKQRHRGH